LVKSSCALISASLTSTSTALRLACRSHTARRFGSRLESKDRGKLRPEVVGLPARDAAQERQPAEVEYRIIGRTCPVKPLFKREGDERIQLVLHVTRKEIAAPAHRREAARVTRGGLVEPVIQIG